MRLLDTRLSDMPAHGGDICWAEKAFKRPRQEWLDLSTGISPWCWPIEHIPPSVFQQLPHDTHALIDVASDYYGCPTTQLTPLAGSQCAIEKIPALVPRKSVALPYWGYSEHVLAWQKNGHQIVFYRNFEELLALCENGKTPYAVVINPNNPDTSVLSHEQLSMLERTLVEVSAENHLLVIDEAFIDLKNENSYVGHPQSKNTLILRSVGKFFGLAGIRLGFFISSEDWQKRLAQTIELWPISHPTIYIGTQALADKQWIAQQKHRLIQQSECWKQILSRKLSDYTVYDGLLFFTLFGETEHLFQLFYKAAENGVLLRLIHDRNNSGQSALRIGLPEGNVEHIATFID